jgi:UDP-N-acetylglucosamine:LPS N-acetylglucosamine transferase
MATRRVLLIASGGGHWIELARLSEAFEGEVCQYVSTAPNIAAPNGNFPVLTIPDGSRHSPLKLVAAAFRMAAIIREFRPQIVVTTGAAPGVVALQVAKLFGLRTIWIDSIANVEALSLSGRLARLSADLRLTQWEHLAQRYPRVRYFGHIL